MAKKTFKTYVAEWPNDNSANKIMGIDSDGEPVYIENNIPNNGTSTGLLDGGNLSINFDNTRFNIQEGKGIVLDAVTDPENPVYKLVEWDEITGIEDLFVTLTDLTYVLIDMNGEVVTQGTPFTPSQYRTHIRIGATIHLARTVIENTNYVPFPAHNLSDTVNNAILNNGKFGGIR